MLRCLKVILWSPWECLVWIWTEFQQNKALFQLESVHEEVEALDYFRQSSDNSCAFSRWCSLLYGAFELWLLVSITPMYGLTVLSLCSLQLLNWPCGSQQVPVHFGLARVLGEQECGSDAGSSDEWSRSSHYGPVLYERWCFCKWCHSCKWSIRESVLVTSMSSFWSPTIYCSRWVEFVTWFQVLWSMQQCSTLVATRWTGWRLMWVSHRCSWRLSENLDRCCNAALSGLFCRERIGLSTSLQSLISPMWALKPTSPRRRMTIWWGRWWRCSSQENLWPLFLSIRLVKL